MIAFFMKFQMIFSIVLSFPYVPWGFSVANQLFFFDFFQNATFLKKEKCLLSGFSLDFRFRSKFTISFSNEKLFVTWFFIGNENLSFSEEIFRYNQCKENDSKILKSCEKSPPGFQKILFPRPQRGTNARAKSDIF